MNDHSGQPTDVANVWRIATRLSGATCPFILHAVCLDGSQEDFRVGVYGHARSTVALHLGDLVRERRVEAVIFDHSADAPEAWLRKQGIRLLKIKPRRPGRRTEELFGGLRPQTPRREPRQGGQKG